MFGHQPLVVYLCVSECIYVSAHKLPYWSAIVEWLIKKLTRMSCTLQYFQQCVNFLYVGYNTANNVSHFGGDPVTQLIVNVYQMKFIPQIHM